MSAAFEAKGSHCVVDGGQVAVFLRLQGTPDAIRRVLVSLTAGSESAEYSATLLTLIKALAVAVS